jgi:hypothetical protein
VYWCKQRNGKKTEVKVAWKECKKEKQQGEQQQTL